MNPMNDPHVRSGAVIALRLFDIAYSVDLRAVESLWKEKGGGMVVRSSLSSTPAKAVSFDVAPLLLDLGPIPITVGGTPLQALLSARLYDFGVAALAIRIPVTDLGWKDFTAFCNEVERALGATAGKAPWPSLLQKIMPVIAPAMIRPNAVPLEEDHLITLVNSWKEPIKASILPEIADLGPLLSGESRPLSEQTRGFLLKHRFSHSEEDLVILTWDRAFICEPGDDSDAADVIEVANAQLLQFRYYDELLNGELPMMYELVKKARRAANILAPRRFADLARRLYTLVAEVTELTAKAGNVLQVTEDVHLARIHQAALEVLRVPTVSASVERKLSIIRDTYAALYAEASGSRAELLELAIILLIVIEIVIALIRHGI